MPNPILPSWGQLKSAGKQAKAVALSEVDINGKPEAPPLTVHAEGRGPYLPYRGANVHGGPQGGQWDNPQGYNDGTVSVEYADEIEHPHAVDVRIIKDDREQYPAFRASQTIVNNVASQIVNRARNRVSVDIANMSGAEVLFIGHDQSVSAYNGFPLGPTTKMTINTTEAIFAVIGNVDPNVTVTVAILAQYTQET